MKSDLARNLLYLLPNTYSYPTTITLGMLRSGKSVKYVKINAFSRRKTGTSDIRIIKDGVRFFMIIVRICMFYSPLKVFLPTSVCLFLIGLAYYAYTFFDFRPVYQHERTSLHHLHPDIHAGPDFRADQPDAL